ncbi:RICIN domain-containing protein [Streptomyces sp. SS]|uniref:RICIN domain-containing protein n=1 Tax=Streptomyces sp. SS TaxID=260742 RepID=UPI00030BA9A4|nr:RICIN domain-containing protein [Streptomyces sp. SS]
MRALKKMGAVGAASGILLMSAAVTPASAMEEYSEVRNAWSDQCLEVADWRMDDGAPVRQWPCHGGRNQQWRFIEMANGHTAIQNRNSNKCIDAPGGNYGNGTQLIQWDCHLRYNQQWLVMYSSEDPQKEISFWAPPNNQVIEIGAWSRTYGAAAGMWSSNDGLNQKWNTAVVYG